MPKIKFTQKGIEALVKKHHDRQTDYSDAIPRTGLVLRVGPRGAAWSYLRVLARMPDAVAKAQHDAAGGGKGDSN